MDGDMVINRKQKVYIDNLEFLKTFQNETVC